jgi:hypothetical protein
MHERERLKQYLKERKNWTVADLRIEHKKWEFIGQELAKLAGPVKGSDIIEDVLPPEAMERLRLVIEMAYRDEYGISNH